MYRWHLVNDDSHAESSSGYSNVELAARAVRKLFVIAALHVRKHGFRGKDEDVIVGTSLGPTKVHGLEFHRVAVLIPAKHYGTANLDMCENLVPRQPHNARRVAGWRVLTEGRDMVCTSDGRILCCVGSRVSVHAVWTYGVGGRSTDGVVGRPIVRALEVA